MSLGNCIPGMVERGEIDEARAKRMAALFDELSREYAKTMSPEAAAAQASEETLKQLAAKAALKKRQTMLQVKAQERAKNDMGRYRSGVSYAAVRAMMDDDLRAPYGSVVRQAEVIEFQAQADLREFIERHRRGFSGKPKDARGMDDVVRELHGQATGNARAKAFADAVADTYEKLRLRFNAAGGDIGKLRGHGLVHRHDPIKVRQAGYAQWRADILREIDTNAMRDPDTGGQLTQERLSDLLRNTYEAIRTNGLIDDADPGFYTTRKLANRRAEHRELVFRDGDAWMRYDRKYGTGNPFTAIMGHINGMSHDIASLERFGPNPDATVKHLLDVVDRVEAQSDKPRPGVVAGIAGGRKRAENLWKYLQGENNVPVLAEGWLERPSYYALRTIAGTRDVLTSALLGSSPISAISDVNTQLMTRKLNGLPQARVLLSYLKQINPASAADRRLAIRLGLGMRDASRSLLGLSRYYGNTHSPEITKVIADDVLRASGLNKFTEAGQRAFGLDFLGTLGDHRGETFDELKPALREAFGRYGIDAGAWDKIRAAEPERERGAEWVNTRNIEDREVGDRLMGMVLAETTRAVQETTASARAGILFGTNPGTLPGEFLRNSFQFKGFALSLMMQQAQVLQMLGPYRAASYAAQFFVGMTLFGATSIQLREIAKGRDPRPMDNAEFWQDAAFQGGGLGIFGDLIGSFTSSRIDSLAGFALGPFYGLVKDLKGSATKALPHTRKDGTVRPGDPAAAGIGLAKRYVPGSDLWYLRAAYEREILDRLSEQYDPDYATSRVRVQQWAREQGQGIWWQAGERAPGRAPDMSAIAASSARH